MEYRHDINEPASVKALVWILGTFPQHIEEAPYLLE
jgi:hypothetical protein